MSNDTGMASMSQEDFEAMVKAEYARLRAAWFPAAKPDYLSAQVWEKSQQPADLSFAWDNAADCGYIYAKNSLIIAAEQGWLEMGPDLDEGEAATAVYSLNAEHKFNRDWSPWRVYLLHEMCHEYQFKILFNHDQTSAGREMFHAVYCARNKPVKFVPTGLHPTTFLAAIASLADHFGADRVNMFDRL